MENAALGWDRSTPPPPDQSMPCPDDRIMDEMVSASVQLGHDIVDVAGFFDGVDDAAAEQVTRLTHVRDSARSVSKASTSMVGTTERLSTVMGSLIDVLATSTTQLHQAIGASQQVMGWVSGVGGPLARIDEAMRATQASNSRILDIAREVNMLAMNAKIEAARAGDRGRGFAVVADAVNTLSAQTTTAARLISEMVGSLAGEIAALRAEAEVTVSQAETGLRDLASAGSALEHLGTQAGAAESELAAMGTDAQEMRTVMQGFAPTFLSLYEGVIDQTQMINDARRRVSRLITLSERMVQNMFALGGASEDRPLIEAVMQSATRLGEALEQAVDRGDIRQEQLFSSDYRPVPGSNPAQVLAPFTSLTDKLFPPVQEQMLTLDPRIVFCAAVTRDGYLPTHNKKFSARQSNDPVWNTANCRNRRVFDDRVGLGAGQSTAPFLMQIYRRDMGGGTFVMMKDVSAPIMVNGRHWGGLRLAYRF
ncbi:MAG: methyl-accepting chemotaxis protein [Pseudotabrizicola sp.]|uniref:methyl-accepting chemotaxis protein n=1 Tax=Pseudotabrizicola sp. TaxID=2939647 RepID=UPI0027232752|nr:methyl-accepting chemotaxis protein [Pseudotabrizicola sp.]MDO9641382.1 methyl-accepting chemotaxis protein [Pseudotabrizicola sp.]